MIYDHQEGFPDGSVGKEATCQCNRYGSILESERSPVGGNGNPLQYSCLGNPIDREAQGATVHKVAKSQARLSNLVLTNTIIRKRQGLCKISYRCGTNPKIGTESRKWVDCEGSFLNLAMEWCPRGHEASMFQNRTWTSGTSKGLVLSDLILASSESNSISDWTASFSNLSF